MTHGASRTIPSIPVARWQPIRFAARRCADGRWAATHLPARFASMVRSTFCRPYAYWNFGRFCRARWPFIPAWPTRVVSLVAYGLTGVLIVWPAVSVVQYLPNASTNSSCQTVNRLRKYIGNISELRHDVEKAMNATKHASDVCDKYRKPNNLAGRLTTFGSSNVEEDHFTDVQLHAELCYAEALLERALLTFVQDENLISFLKGAIRIRSCYQSYKKCQQHMYSHSWQDDAVRSHFESGVKLGDGTFSLLISALPSRVLKLLEFAGFNGNRDYGLRQLKSAALMHYTLRWPLSALVLLVWNLNFVYILGTGESDLLLSEKLILDMLSIYPASSLVLFFSGRYAEITGDFAKAIQLFQSSIDQQTEWRQFHHLCFWELIFCHSFLRDWRKARQYAEALYAENKWSRSTYAYLSACCLMSEIGIGERSTQEGAPTDETVETILHLMRQVPLLKVKLSGKSLPVEKFCMAKSNQFFSQNNSLFIPLYELLYFWNCYTCIGRNESAVLSILDDIERQYQRRKSTCAEGMSADDHCLYLLLKAMCLKQLQSPFQAEQLLLEIVNKKQDLKVNTYLAPNAYLELALLRLDNRKSDLAKQFVLKAKEFKGYLLESRVHFRLHSLEQRIEAS